MKYRRFFSTILLISAAAIPSRATTSPNRAVAFIKSKNPTCQITPKEAPLVGHINGSDKEVTVLHYILGDCKGGGWPIVTFSVLYGATGGRYAEFDNDLQVAEPEKITLKDGVITVSSLDWTDDDARCCPSIKKTFHVVVSGGKLTFSQ